MAEGMVVAVAGDGGDPRINNPIIKGGVQSPSAPLNRMLHDPSITFEEYRYFAELTRAEEKETAKTEGPSAGIMQMLFPTKSSAGVQPISASPGSPGSSYYGEDEKELSQVNADRQHRLTIDDAEWTNASRAMRTASGAACFYLITTDILGPFGIG
jgi:hypothetical protein